MELGRTNTFKTGLRALALIVAAAALGLTLLTSGPKVLEIPVSAPRIQQATWQEMEQAWENLVDAIRRGDQIEALRIAEWLDEQQQASKASLTPVVNLEIVKTWCALRGDLEGICKEESNAEK